MSSELDTLREVGSPLWKLPLPVSREADAALCLFVWLDASVAAWISVSSFADCGLSSILGAVEVVAVSGTAVDDSILTGASVMSSSGSVAGVCAPAGSLVLSLMIAFPASSDDWPGIRCEF